MESLIGKRFGMLIVVDEFYKKDSKGHNKRFAKCKCDCGNEKEIYKYSLTCKNHVSSCGCKLQEVRLKGFNKKHNLYKTPLYHIWKSMKGRCYNPNNEKYKNYGGRGIKVCDEWGNNFKAFYDWATNNGYKEGLTIDRVDVNSNYEPNNCRWVDMITQENNRTNNRIVTYHGRQLTLAELSRETKVPYKKLYERITKYKWAVERAVNN